jgi:hypothetical protein
MVQTGGRRKRSKTGRKASAKFLAAGNAWRQHVKKTMAENVGKDFKTILRIAKQTYKRAADSVMKLSNSRVSVQVRTKRAGKSKGRTKRAKKRSTRKKRSSGLFGF